MAPYLVIVLSLSLVLLFVTTTIDGYSSSSPWAPSTWLVTLDVGGPIPSGYASAMDRLIVGEGGGQGSREGGLTTRIVTTVQVQVTSMACPVVDRIVGSGASLLQPQSVGTYITLQGQQQIQFSQGGWTLALREKPKASLLQLWMDLESEIRKNDWIIPRGERLYCVTQAWRETEYELAVRTMRPIHQRYSQAQKALALNLSHESGDRRLDGTDALETLQAYGDMAQLVLQRDLTRAEYQRALDDYPPVVTSGNGETDLVLPEGPWPGSDEWLTMGPKEQNPILVATPGKGLFGAAGGELRAIGTWTAKPVLSEEDYEYVDEDDLITKGR